jgi:hypothetical protein
MRLLMRRLLVLLGVSVLALPSSASAQSLEYAAPTASISRGAPLTFAVRTDAPAGSVVVRVSGYDETDDAGLLTGPDGTWLDETATPAVDNLQVWTVPAASILRQRPGHYYWQAYLTGEAANAAEEPIGEVQELVVTTPRADRGRGKLHSRFGRRGKGSFYLSSANFPAIVDGKRFQKLARTTASRWGLKAKRWTSVKAGVQDGFNVAGFSTRIPEDTLGVQTDFMRGGVVIERDLELNADQNWTAGPNYPTLDQIDLESVLLHELGHMAGNKRHLSRCTNSPMGKSLGAGEWWRGSRDKWFGQCSTSARASSLKLEHRVVRLR